MDDRRGFFSEVAGPIPFAGLDATDPLAFRVYDPARIVRGKRMEDHLRIAVCLWHSFNWPGSDVFGVGTFGTGIFVTYLVPTSLLFLPLAQVVNRLGLADSVWALIVTYPTFLVPFCTWLLLGYFRTIPQEIEECAMVDGCTRFQALIRIVLPVAIPGIVCAILFAFTISWNEFIYALTFISSTAQKTTTVGVTAELIRGDIFYWGSLMAGAVLGSIPIVLVYVVFMDYYVSGLTQGAIK
jgi:multiple sugar transport system permease protein